jgi:hypothetical protein
MRPLICPILGLWLLVSRQILPFHSGILQPNLIGILCQDESLRDVLIGKVTPCHPFRQTPTMSRRNAFHATRRVLFTLFRSLFYSQEV